MVSQILRTRAEKPAPSERSALIIEVGDTWRIWGGKEDRREEWVGSTTQALNQLNRENKSVALNAHERLVGTEGVSAAQQQLRRGLCPRQERRLSRRRKTLQTRDANPTLSPTFLLSCSLRTPGSANLPIWMLPSSGDRDFLARGHAYLSYRK